MLLRGELNHAIEGDGLHYVSLVTGIQRFIGHGDTATTVATAISFLVGLIGFFAAWRWHRAGREWIGLSLCGIATIFLSPVAWNYYYVFVVPAALIVVRQLAKNTPMPRTIQFTLVIAAIWAAFEFHLRLPNDGVIESSYTNAQRVVAMMLPLTSAVVLIAAAIFGRRRPEAVREAAEPQSDPEEADGAAARY